MRVVYVSADGKAQVLDLPEDTAERLEQVEQLLPGDLEGTKVTPTVQMIVPLTVEVTVFPAMFEGIDPDTRQSVSLTDQQVQAILALLAAE